jgi:hypothetical protein
MLLLSRNFSRVFHHMIFCHYRYDNIKQKYLEKNFTQHIKSNDINIKIHMIKDAQFDL